MIFVFFYWRVSSDFHIKFLLQIFEAVLDPKVDRTSYSSVDKEEIDKTGVFEKPGFF